MMSVENTQLEVFAPIPMTETEARQKTHLIKQGLAEMRRLLLEMYEREGWKVLGYSSWREYGQAEFGYSETRIYELIGAARVERNISGIPETPTEQLYPLAQLEPDQQRKAWAHAVETAPNGKITGAHVKRVVEALDNPATWETSDKYSRPHVANNSGNNEWYTPPEYIEAARFVMGAIDCDPASSDLANETVQAKIYYTAEEDGLSQPWHGRVWMNPPYAQPLITEFCEALASHWEQGHITEACVLVNNATDTGWFHTLLSCASCICLIKGRVRFIDKEGNPSGAPLQGQAILYMGENSGKFAQEFHRFGGILYARQDSP